MIIFTAISQVVSVACRSIIKLLGVVEDVVDITSVTTAEALNDALEDAGITKDQLNTNYEARLKPLKVKKQA